MEINELIAETPLRPFNKILLKNDNFFKLGYVSGGKLRQAIYLIQKNLELIKLNFESVVVCSCSNKSPQSAIISEVCKYFGLKCKIVTFKTEKPNTNLSIAQINGAELYGTRVGWNSVIEARARSLRGFYIKMGFASEDIIESNVYQVQNIPNYLDYIIVPVGSGYNFISIMKGIEKYGKKVKQVIGVWVGKDPTETIQSYLKGNENYKLIQYPMNYSSSLKTYPYFDEIYEAKAYDWLINKSGIDLDKNKILFWVVGKRNSDFKPIKLNWIDI